MARKMIDSGVQWIGDIPENWIIARTKNCYTNHKNIAGDAADDYERLALTLNGVIKRPKDDSIGLQPEAFNGYQILREHELVFKLIDLANVATSRVGYSPYLGLVSPAYIVLHPNEEEESKYGVYYFLSMWQREIFNHMGDDGVRSSLNAGDLLNIPYLIIPIEEKQRIVSFLDKECAHIDSTIKQTRVSIEEYKNMKQAVITQAVTKGIRPGRRMKDSGIEWIGEIPDEWEISTISNNIGFEGGSQPPLTSFVHEQKEGYVRLIQNRDYKTDAYLTYVPVTSALKYCDEDDVMIGRYGPPTFVMHRGLKGAYNVALMKAIPKGIDREWMAFVLQEYTLLRYVESFSKRAAGQDGVNPIILKKYPLPLPSIEEQKEIACYLQKQMKEYDRLIDLKESLISDLESYKKSLVYEYVTGKKEVTA